MNYFDFLIEHIKSPRSLLTALVSALATIFVDSVQKKRAFKRRNGTEKAGDLPLKKRIVDGTICFVLIWVILLFSDGTIKYIDSRDGGGSITPSTPSPETPSQTFPPVGDTLIFGTYNQSGEPNSWNNDPITWIVLTRDDDKAFLISQQGLIYKPILESRTGGEKLKWNQSSLNDWLQNEFCTNSSFNGNGAFSEYELNAIIKNDDNTYRLGLLTEEEAEVYFSGPKERKCSPTLYAGYICEHNPNSPKGKVPTPNYSGDYWWLCNPGNTDYTYMTVDNEGNIKKDGTYYDYSGIMVRPTVWILIEEYLKLR